MTDFTTLFQQTLNETIAKMVESSLQEMRNEISELKSENRYLTDKVNELENQLEDQLSESDIEYMIDSAMERFDFETAVTENLPCPDSMAEIIADSQEFEDAVKTNVERILSKASFSVSFE